MKIVFIALLWVASTHASPTREAAPPDLGGEQVLSAQSPAQYEESTLVEYDEFEGVGNQDEMPFGWNSPLGLVFPGLVRRDRRQAPDNDGSGDHEGSGDQEDAQDQVWYEGPAQDNEFGIYRRPKSPKKPSPKQDKKGKKTKGQHVKSSAGKPRSRWNEHYNLRQNPAQIQPEAGPSSAQVRPASPVQAQPLAGEYPAQAQPVAGPSGLQPRVDPQDRPGTYVLQGPENLNQWGRFGDSNVLGVESGSGVDCRQCQGSDCYICDNPGPRCNVIVMDANNDRDEPRLFEDEPRIWYNGPELSNRIEFQQETFDPWTQVPDLMLESILTCCEDCPVDDCICSGDSRCEKFLSQPFNNDRTTTNRYRAFLEHKRKRSHRYVFGYSKKNWSDTKRFRDGSWAPRNTTTTTTPRPDGPDGGPPRRGSHGHRVELRSAPMEEYKSQIGRLFEALGIKPQPFTQQYLAVIREQVRGNPRWDDYEGTVEEYIFCLFQ